MRGLGLGLGLAHAQEPGTRLFKPLLPGFFKRMSKERSKTDIMCDLDCQLKLIANLLHSFHSAVILNIRSF